MKLVQLCLFSLIALTTKCQVTFTVDGFSDRYFGKLFISDTAEVFSKGWVAVYDRKTKAQLIKVSADELTFELHEGKVLANIRQLPYGEQSQIIHEDFNFDGRKDFAIMDGQNSCYHGPSFRIYLASAQGFQFSKAFTRLAHEYCGMFQTDMETREIMTMTKSGCCWHQFSRFKVKNNKPYAVFVVEEGMGDSGVTWNYVKDSLVNGQMKTSHYSFLADDEIGDSVFLRMSFANGKTLQLFHYYNILYYAFTAKDETIELLFSDQFAYDQGKGTVSFVKGKTEYRVSNDGVTVRDSGKTIEMKAIPGKTIGSLDALKAFELENVKAAIR
jgi:hypothetical protein